MTMMTNRRAATLLALGSALAGCTVGPAHPGTNLSYAPPTAATTLAPQRGPAQLVEPGAPTPADWWTRFRVPALDALVAQALAANNDIASAEANLRQARALAGVARGNAGPQVDAGYNVERTRLSGALSSPLDDPNASLYTLHTSQLSVSYPLDLFGLQRNRIRSAVAQAEVSRQRLLAARLTVVNNLVVAAIEHASLAAQIASAQASVDSNRRIVDLLTRRQQLGDVGARDVAAQTTALAQAEAALPPLRRALVHQEALIATLTGVAAGSPLPVLPALDAFTLPTDLPVALPADVVAARPDVRAAEAQMTGAGADVGAAIAARLPQVTLGANAGGSATDFTKMFASGNPFWQLLGGITAPIFHSGALKRQQQASEAALDAAKAAYRQAALQAFVDVSDALTGLATDTAALDAAARADEAATRTLTFTRRQAELGNVDGLQLLNASSQQAQAALSLVQARAARLADTAALFQATGGGVEAGPTRP